MLIIKNASMFVKKSSKKPLELKRFVGLTDKFGRLESSL